MILNCEKYESRERLIDYSVVTFDRSINYFALAEAIHRVANDMKFEVKESLRNPTISGLDECLRKKHKNVKFKYRTFVCKPIKEKKTSLDQSDNFLVVGFQISNESYQVAIGLENDWPYDPREIFIDNLVEKLSQIGHG